jgi:ketosteroid isomerase-like protein
VTATGRVSADRRALLLRAYAAYNNQDVATLLTLVSDDVDWPDEAGRLQGKGEVRAAGGIFWQAVCQRRVL